MGRNRMLKNKTVPKRKALEKLSEQLDLPGLELANAHIEMFGNSEVIVDGCKGVLEYDDGVIRLNAGRNIIRFTGSDLTIKTLTVDQAIIQGNILSIDFST